MSVLEKYKTMEYGPALEDPKDTLVWLDGHKRRFGHFIGGKWQFPVEGNTLRRPTPRREKRLRKWPKGAWRTLMRQ